MRPIVLFFGSDVPLVRRIVIHKTSGLFSKDRLCKGTFLSTNKQERLNAQISNSTEVSTLKINLKVALAGKFFLFFFFEVFLIFFFIYCHHFKWACLPRWMWLTCFGWSNLFDFWTKKDLFFFKRWKNPRFWSNFRHNQTRRRISL